MRRQHNLSPAQLLAISFAGTALSASIFVLPLAWLRSSTHANWLLFAIGIIVLLSGVSISLRANADIRDGIANLRWSDSELDPIRHPLNSGAITILQVVFFIAFTVFTALSHDYHQYGWALFMLLQEISSVRLAFRELTPKAPTTSWSNFGPIHSEHWGQR